VRNVLSGTKLFETNPLFEQAAKKHGLYNKEILAKIAGQGSVQNIKAIPANIKKIFVTAFDVKPSQHLQIQAAFQRHTDNAVSKTINLPADSTVEDVRQIYFEAHKLKCKGITIYRYGSKKEQVLSFEPSSVALRGTEHSGKPQPQLRTTPIYADAEYSGGCATGICSF
jgi:ribonucleoside-diphosphate reductase alpha chain